MDTLVYRLNRSIERFNEFCRLDAPIIIKKAELTLIKEICNELLINIDSKGE